MNLNPHNLTVFADWATAAPPRPLPRTAVPVPGEYHLDYVYRLARANHVEFLELADMLQPPRGVIFNPRHYQQHEQERLAAAARQPSSRITRLYWPDHARYLSDPEGFRQRLRPACRRCTARRGIREPVACHLPDHQTVCRRHRLWTGPSARTLDDQLDISQLPEVLRAHRLHHYLVQACRHLPWQPGDAIRDAASTIHHACATGAWTAQQRQRLQGLSVTQVAGRAGRRWPHDSLSTLAREIATYPELIRLANHTLQDLTAPGP